MREITLLSPASLHDAVGPRGATGLLFECAPDSRLRVSSGDTFSLPELIGSIEDTKRRAYELTSRLLRGEPSMRGIGQLGVFEEVLLQELAGLLHLLRLDAFLESNRFRRCRFHGFSPLAAGLRAVQALTASSYQIEAPSPAVSPLRARWAEHWGREGFSVRGARRLVQRAIRRALPFSSHLVARRLARPNEPERGGWWFYTTAYTFTRIGMAYEPHLPQPLRYLVEDWQTGGLPLREAGRHGWSLYSFAEWSDVPNQREVRAAAASIAAHLQGIVLSGAEAHARELFLGSDWFRLFRERLLPAGLFEAAIFDRWLDRVRPDAVLVGNAAFESRLLRKAKRRGIPTFLLQHGIFGDPYQLFDPPVDRILARGPFFGEFLSEAGRRKASILNVPQAEAAGPVPAARGCDLIFLTTPCHLQRWSHESDLNEILHVVARAAADAGRTLIVRVHPLETVHSYAERLERICRELGVRPAIEYSQGPGLEEALSRSACAVLFFSTVFLDCLRLGVPIVSCGWHNFSIKPMLEKESAFHFADSLAHLSELVRAGLAGRLEAGTGIERFLAPTLAGEVRNWFADTGWPVAESGMVTSR